MRQFSIKNERAADLLDRITRFTGEGKTEAVIRALELYEGSLMQSPDVAARIESIRHAVHGQVRPEYRGKAPGKSEIEAELGMP
jgi:hypothetical protein